MARERKPVHKVQMTEGKRNIIRQVLSEFYPVLYIDAIHCSVRG